MNPLYQDTEREFDEKFLTEGGNIRQTHRGNYYSQVAEIKSFIREREAIAYAKALEEVREKIPIGKWNEDGSEWYGCCGEEETGWDAMRLKVLAALDSLKPTP